MTTIRLHHDPKKFMSGDRVTIRMGVKELITNDVCIPNWRNRFVPDMKEFAGMTYVVKSSDLGGVRVRDGSGSNWYAWPSCAFVGGDILSVDEVFR